MIWVRLQRLASASYRLSTKYPFTLRLICADGQRDERTFRLKFEAR